MYKIKNRKNREKYMRLRNHQDRTEVVGESKYVIHEMEKAKGNGLKFFKTIIRFILKLEWVRDVLLLSLRLKIQTKTL